MGYKGPGGQMSTLMFGYRYLYGVLSMTQDTVDLISVGGYLYFALRDSSGRKNLHEPSDD